MSEMKTTSAKKTSGYNFGLKGWRIIGFEIWKKFSGRKRQMAHGREKPLI